MRRLQTGLLLMLAAFLISAAPALAAEKEGSICIELLDLESPHSRREGVEFNFWKVGQVDENEMPSFDSVYEIDAYPTTAAGLEEAARRVAEKLEGQPVMTVRTDADGRACAEHVGRGLYLIMAAKENPYGQVSPFLVPIPYLDEKTGTVFYEVTAEPKASPYEEEKPEKPDPSVPPDHSRPAGGAQTGDTAPVEGYIILAVISLAGILLFLAYDREKKRKQKEGREKR